MMQFRTRPAALLRGAAGVALALAALGAAAAGGVQQLRDFVAGARSAEGEFEQMERAGLVSPMGSNGNREVIVPAKESE